MKIYISGALTGIKNSEEIKLFYESIGRLCQKLGFKSYVPHLHTDPVKNPHITPEQIFKTDKQEVTNSNLVIAYLGIPSFGVGMELAFAAIQEIPIILLYEKDKNISRFPRGIPTKISEIQFLDYQNALEQLELSLSEYSIINKSRL